MIAKADKKLSNVWTSYFNSAADTLFLAPANFNKAEGKILFDTHTNIKYKYKYKAPALVLEGMLFYLLSFCWQNIVIHKVPFTALW